MQKYTKEEQIEYQLKKLEYHIKRLISLKCEQSCIMNTVINAFDKGISSNDCQNILSRTNSVCDVELSNNGQTIKRGSNQYHR